MRYEYDTSITPALLSLPVSVSSRRGGDAAEVLGKIDTGAGITCIPDDLSNKLGLKHGKPVRVFCPPAGKMHILPTRRAIVSMADRSFPVDVVPLPRANALIGRDILNQLVLHADGPSQVFSIT